MAPAPVSVPQEWTPLTLDALFGIVQDATADAKARRKAALKIAEFLLPKVAKKAKILPDEYGFLVNPNLASAYRDAQLELRALMTGPTHNIPAIAEKIKKLDARSDAIRRRLQVPCPTKYTDNEAANDYARLLQFSSLRESERPLSEMQEAEEAHRRVRFDVFAHSPEQVFRRRLMVLEEVERRSQKSRVFKESLAPRFSAKDQKSLSGYDGFTRSRAEASFGITAASLECRKVGRSMNCPITTRSRTNGHL